MQGDAIAAAAMGVGAPRVTSTEYLGPGGEVHEEARRHRECFAREFILGCQRKVLLRLPSLPLGHG